jgi:DNA-binding MurR/RpiR family transcriptional regulator
VFEEIIKLRENDVLIGISFPRYSTRTLEAMRFAKRCGAQVVAITDGPMSPLAEIADLSLTARTDMASFVDSLAAPLSLINALLVTLGLRGDVYHKAFARKASNSSGELVDLITAQRNFQANSRSLEVNSSLQQNILQIR